MAWIESHQTLKNHPKTKKLARKLSVSIPTAIGHLHCLWWWALDYADDGDLSKYDNEDIADAAMLDVEYADDFVNAMIESGFIDEANNGYILHDWYDYAGKLIERRKANIERARKWREERAKRTQNDESTDTNESRMHNEQIRTHNESATYNATVPNRTIPNHTIPNLKKEEQEILAVLQSVKNYPYDEPTDLECIRKLAADYPEVDLLQEIKHWATWVIDKPLKKKGESRPRSQIRNWVRKAKEFQQRDRNKNTRRPKDRRSQSFEDYMQEAMDYAPE
jgi:hypothetical protein